MPRAGVWGGVGTWTWEAPWTEVGPRDAAGQSDKGRDRQVGRGGLTDASRAPGWSSRPESPELQRQRGERSLRPSRSCLSWSPKPGAHPRDSPPWFTSAWEPGRKLRGQSFKGSAVTFPRGAGPTLCPAVSKGSSRGRSDGRAGRRNPGGSASHTRETQSLG